MMFHNRVAIAAGIVLCATAILQAADVAPKSLMKFEKGDTIEVLRAKIMHNGYKFKVGHNWVFDMPPEMKEEFFSRHPSRVPMLKEDDMGPLEKKIGKTTLPTSFDWRSRDGHAYIGPVRDQGDCGSCYAFGAAAAAEGSYNILKGLVDGSCADFSEAFIAWCLGGMSPYSDHFSGCNGADFDYQELQALVDQGITNESVFPYSGNQNGQVCPGSAWNASRVCFNNWYRVPCGDIDAIKTAIYTYGVVDAAVDVTGAFQGYVSGVYYDASATGCPGVPCEYTDTNHAISLVGWDDFPPEGGGGCWILRNSWGTSWGESGYMRIRYDTARVSCEVAYLAGPYDYNPPVSTPVPVSPVRVATDTGDYAGSYDYMGIWVSSDTFDRLSYVFVRIATPYYGTFYLTSSERILPYPAPYLPYPIIMYSPIVEYYLATLRWRDAQAGGYRIESGAVPADAIFDGAGNINYLNGTYDSKAFTLW
ncbi:MAG: C1 family peptidase [Candidatus Aureabacteria bacterium]|nr:C1 family peptidase [Candidatus Auribacterota bacterium]